MVLVILEFVLVKLDILGQIALLGHARMIAQVMVLVTQIQAYVLVLMVFLVKIVC